MRISDWSSDVCSSDLDAVSCRVAAAAARVVAGTHTITVGTIGFAADRLADAAVCLDLTPAPTAGFLVELVGVRRWNCCPADCVVPVGARPRHGQCRCCWRWNGTLNSLCWRVVAATADGSSSDSTQPLSLASVLLAI